MKTFTLIISFLLAFTVNAQIINVGPTGTYSTVQAGITAANAGDTVLVADGIYYEQINFLGKAITVASHYIIDNDPAHIDNTILDGNLLTAGQSSVVLLNSGEDTTSIISGFTIRNGTGTLNDVYLQGGGIYLQNSGAKIMHNRITQNILDATRTQNNYCPAGAGIATQYLPGDKWVVIMNNTITNNQCISDYYDAGGAAVLSTYNTRMLNNTISNNASICTVNGNTYAAVYAESLLTLSDNWFLAQNNTITYNSAISDNIARGAGLLCTRLNTSIINNNISYNDINTPYIGTNFGGGGIYFENPLSTVVKGNSINNNTSSGCGGGLNILENSSSGTVVIENNTFNSNSTDMSGGAMYFDGNNDDQLPIICNNNFISNQSLSGGAVYARNSDLLFTNNTFHLNVATGNGGALYLLKSGISSTSTHFINNSFSENSAEQHGGAISSSGNNMKFLNNIFWQDIAPIGAEMSITQGSASIAYSNIDISKIEGTVESLEGNLLVDPIFCQTYCLMPDGTSPCLNIGIDQYIFSGQDTLTAPLFDILYQLRPLGNNYDMGAYEVSMAGIPEVELKLEFSLFPNPFNSKFYCHYRLDEASNITITVYDILGRIKATWHKEQGVGDHITPIDPGNLANGVYMVKVEIGYNSMVRKIVKQ